MKKTSKKRNKPVSTQKTLKELLETEKRILVEGAFEAMNGGQALSPTWKHNIGDRVNFAGYSDGDNKKISVASPLRKGLGGLLIDFVSQK